MPPERIAAVLAVAVAFAAGIGVYLWLQEPERLPDSLSFAQPRKPKPLPALGFLDGLGRARTLADFRGRLVVLNLWATWCAPCREEMPALDRLQAKLGGPGFEVVALSIDQQGAQAVRRFFDEVGVRTLQLYVDPSAQAGFKLGTIGLPTTLIIDREGREIGRHVGPAKWDAPEIVEGLRQLAEGAR